MHRSGHEGFLVQYSVFFQGWLCHHFQGLTVRLDFKIYWYQKQVSLDSLLAVSVTILVLNGCFTILLFIRNLTSYNGDANDPTLPLEPEQVLRQNQFDTCRL